MINQSGSIYTFYSFKGGVGRSMALANVAALLASWGQRVLVVDWDLEAPSIERYFAKHSDDIIADRRKTAGIVDLIHAYASKRMLDWRRCLITTKPFDPGPSVDILSAGKNDNKYVPRVQSINWIHLFEKSGLGNYLEILRAEWTSEYDYILIDSRTGITDIGGICTIHLPDVLVLFLTTNRVSLDGVIEVMKRARARHNDLPFDRNRLIGIPVPARDESRTEVKQSKYWQKIFADELDMIYSDWLPEGDTPNDVLDKLRIPYVPYWSFQEGLPVIEDGTSDPSGLGAAYGLLAKLIFYRLQWRDVISGKEPDEDVEVLRRLAETRPGLDSELAEGLRKRSAELRDIGDLRAATETIQEVVEIYRRLTAANPARFEPDLAGNLNNLSIRLSEAGDNAGALEAIREAVDFYRRLAAANPARFEPDLAGNLNNLSIRFSEAGDNAGALGAIREAVEIDRRLAAANPARFEPNLAMSLNNLSNRLGDLGDDVEAMQAVREAAEVRRRLAAANPARFEPDLASSLNNLSNRLGDAGDGVGALEAIRDSVEVYRRLAAANPARFEPNLAMSLNNLSNHLSEAGDGAGALGAIREAVEVYRRLAAANPARFEPELASSLNNLSNRLGEAGDVAAALEAIREAVDIRRRLAAANSTRFEPDLAMSLNNLSEHLSEADDVAAALEAIREAVEVFRRLAAANPARFEPDLATSLNNLSNRLSEVGDGVGALGTMREAVELITPYAKRFPDGLHAKGLATMEANLQRLVEGEHGG